VKKPIKIIKSSQSARPALSENAIALFRFFGGIWIDYDLESMKFR